MVLIDLHDHILDLLAAYGVTGIRSTRDPESRTIVLRKGARFLGLTDAMLDCLARPK